MEFAQVAGRPGGVFPILPGFICLQPRPHWLRCLREAAQGAQVESGLINQERLVCFGEVAAGTVPGTVEEIRDGGQVGSEGTQILQAENFFSPVNPRPVHLIHGLLVQPGQAAMGHGLVEGHHPLQGVGQLLGGLLEKLV